MRTLAAAAVLCLIAATAHAQSATPASCKAQATDKKLHGAALTSFMTKCEKDAKTACDASATERKLHGAAQASFTKKCVGDAVGE